MIQFQTLSSAEQVAAQLWIELMSGYLGGVILGVLRLDT